MTETALKNAVKSAIIELLEERNEALTKLIAEIIEDVGLANAMDEATESEYVDREEVFDILSGKE